MAESNYVVNTSHYRGMQFNHKKTLSPQGV